MQKVAVSWEEVEVGFFSLSIIWLVLSLIEAIWLNKLNNNIKLRLRIENNKNVT